MVGTDASGSKTSCPISGESVGERRASLSDLVGEASSAGLYDQKAESYREALRQARADLRGERG